MKFTKLVLLSLLALGLSACGDDVNPNASAFTLSITDAPIDGANAVWLDISGIELQGPNGTVTMDVDVQLDLLALQGNKSALLATAANLAPGDYQSILLKINAAEGVNDSYIDFGDYSVPLYLPTDGAEAGLLIESPFVVEVGERVDLTIDFDLKKSVFNPLNTTGTTGELADYILRPALRVVNNVDAGTITGSVSGAILANNSCAVGNAAVYLFEGVDVVIGDIGGLGAGPLTTALLDIDMSGQLITSTFEIGFVPAGSNYTVALSCTADADDPAVDDSGSPVDANGRGFIFIDQQSTSVTAGATTELVFN